MMGKPYGQYGAETLIAGCLEELRGSSGLGVYKKVDFLCIFKYIMCTLLTLGFDCCLINILRHTLTNHICGLQFVKYKDIVIFLCISYCIPVSLSSSGQVVVPEELRFPHNCCVGIASQTSLSLFNPSERWQQVSITVTNLAIDGEKVNRKHRMVTNYIQCQNAYAKSIFKIVSKTPKISERAARN